MAIKINLQQTEKVLFCSSKWWGDPDMPPEMEYPMVADTEDGEEYPMTFLCQINCEDLYEYDKEGRLPHEGMLYFFAAADGCLGYDAPYDSPEGEWSKGRIKVKYTKTVNFETFNSFIMVDDNDEAVTEPALEMTFSTCNEEYGGLCLLGKFMDGSSLSLLEVDGKEKMIGFTEKGSLHFTISENDLKFMNFNKVKGYFKK